MVLVFLYLSQTEEKTKLSNDPAITMMIISASYLTAISVGFSELSVCKFSYSPLNAAIALGQISMQTFDGDMGETSYQFIFLIFPFAGALIAVFMYECVFRKAEEAVVAEDDREDEMEE